MKICIVGTGPTYEQAPWDDPSWKIWCMAHRLNHFKRIDVGFEMHKHADLVELGVDYLDWLDAPTIPVYTRWPSNYPACKPYPLEDAIKLMGREYFTSSFSYMICKAILDGAKEIGLYGIDLSADDEYSYQRPGAEYLIGLAQGKGIKITIAKGSALLNAPFVYGDGQPMTSNPLMVMYEKRLASCKGEIKRVSCELDQLTGAEHELQEFIKTLKDVERGALKE
tara:strand:- start:37721 stop:38392 length:672 start_codon:yes stop_codon:yes gene_type:complete